MIAPPLAKAAAIALTALAANVPLGALRARSRRFSPAWFLWVHLSVPFIIALRLWNHVSLRAVPAFVACAVCGQLLGGLLASRPGAAR